MQEVLSIAKTVGFGSLSILAVVLSVWLALRVVEFARVTRGSNGRNGNGRSRPKMELEALRLICPLAPSSRSLDDLHDVLVRVVNGIDRLNETQKGMMADTQGRDDKLCDLLNQMRVEFAGHKRGE